MRGTLSGYATHRSYTSFQAKIAATHESKVQPRAARRGSAEKTKSYKGGLSLFGKLSWGYAEVDQRQER